MRNLVQIRRLRRLLWGLRRGALGSPSHTELGEAKEWWGLGRRNFGV